jgi:hypothetical protein
MVRPSTSTGEIAMKNLFRASVAAAALLAGPAFAADFPIKAPPSAQSFFNGYPYGSSGLYVGLYTEGGGGPVTASIPGVNSASLTTTTAGIGGLAGYAWGSKSSPFAYAVECGVSANNFNGQNQGFAVAGPVSGECTGLVWMPVSLIQSAFTALNIPNPFSSIAPFPTLAPGSVATNIQAGFGAGFRADDVTIAYKGVGSGKVVDILPQIQVNLMEQVTGGYALRQVLEYDFASQGKVIGAQQINGVVGNKVMGRLIFAF